MNPQKRFRKLLEPGTIGQVRTRSRMVKVGAHYTWFDYEDGHFPEKALGFYDALAKGGAGLIVVGAASIDHPLGLMPDAGYRIDDDRYIPSLSRVTEVIHASGCPAFLQEFHIGPLFFAARFGHEPIAASSLPKSEMPQPHLAVARALTIPQIEAIMEKFVVAAVRAKKAGFDGVEINAGCKHLLNSFLSLAWNKRDDEYGPDTLENRTRMIVRIVEEIKKRNGGDFAVSALINGAEIGLEKGITVEQSTQIAQYLEKAGADAIHVRVEFYHRPNTGLCESTHFPDVALYPEPRERFGNLIDVSHHGAGGWVPIARSIKHAISIPVIAIGKLDHEMGEKLLRRGDIDFIGLNRRLMADPGLPLKVTEGRLEDIAPCTSCMTCFNALEQLQWVRCRINTALGREKEYEIRPAERKKTVMVVGGGPAGMEAARVAALRGHKVTLYEKTNRLGGSMNVAALIKGTGREDLNTLVRYFENQLAKLGVEIERNREVDRALVEKVKPDALIVAAGGFHQVPDVPGINNPNVLTSEALHDSLKDYLRMANPEKLNTLTRLWMPLGKRAVIIGGGIQGCQVAEFLVKRGRDVTIVETAPEVGEGLLHILMKPKLLLWLKDKGVTMIAGARYEEITDKGLNIVDKDGKRRTIEADVIVTALPLKPSREEFERLYGGAVPEIHCIGDCSAPGMIVDAIHEGARVGRAI
jgi:2,4-dienoyl-CoA reductase (NADPH2)